MNNTKKRFTFDSFFSKALIFYAALIIGSILIFMRFDYRGVPTFGDSRYKEQSNAFVLAVNKALKAAGLCQPQKNEPNLYVTCNTNLDIYTDSALAINQTIYSIEGNEVLFAKYIELAVKEGVVVSGKAPIRIKGYKKTHKYYDENQFERKPFIELEILK